MGYLHIDNLYKNQTILMFKECYAMEKIHGSSAHISWNIKEQSINYFAGGEKHDKFISLFDAEFLKQKFIELFPDSIVVIFGEVYGGKCQGMKETYGNELKFIGFDVKIDDYWLSVPKAEEVCKSLNIEFVSYVKVSTDIESLNAERDKDSVQAIRNGCGEGKKKEGIVLRPLIEFRTNNGGRVISKHKRDNFRETKTPREVNAEEFKIMEDAKLIAEEWVTEMRLNHVLDKLPQDINIDSMKVVIDAMVEDVYREGKDEIVENKNVAKFIGNRTAMLFKKKLQNKLI
jgi:hypothetical protein